MRKVFAVFIILILSTSVCYSQDKKLHPIDQWFSSCTSKDNSTAGMRGCLAKAYDLWDKELNKNYGDLMKALPQDGKAILKSAQQQWVRYKDAEFKLIDKTEGRKSGTMWLVIADDHRVNIIKQRAIELSGYLDAIEE